ncbi:MAG: zinc ribbon domain-containing protein [Chloroflexi bacterium]|nr:zinc ribbon domain-containing protein [Chloroflexota bacterium]
MPTYNYECRQCGAEFNRNLHYNEDPARVDCPNGHAQVRRVYIAPPVVFKGSGYYVTDSHPADSKASPAS